MKKSRKNSVHYRTSLWRKMKRALAFVVVFATTYSLVLPASTMDFESAAEDPGIYIEENQEASFATEEEAVLEPLQTDSVINDTPQEESDTVAEYDEELDGAGDSYIIDSYTETSSYADSSLDNPDDYNVGTSSASDYADESLGDSTVSESASSSEETEAGQEMPAMEFEDSLDLQNLYICVKAEEGTFPTGTVMEVRPVYDVNILDHISDRVKNSVMENVGSVAAVDIAFYYEGEEINPLLPIRVSVSGDPIADREKTIVAHLTEWQDVEAIYQLEDWQILEEYPEFLSQEAIPNNFLMFDAYTYSNTASVYAFLNSGNETWNNVVTAYGSNYEISLTYGPESGLPQEGVSLGVTEIIPESEEYASYVEQYETTLPENRTVTEAKLFDITIYVDGVETQPAGPVQVSIQMTDMQVPEENAVDVVHFADDGTTETIAEEKVELDCSGESVNSVVFEADGFSVYGIVGTGMISMSFVSGDGSTYEVTVAYGIDSGIPDNAKLQVTEITENDLRYDGYVVQSADVIDSRVIDLNYVKLLDIEIVDENFNKVILNKPVDVQIKLLDREYADETTQIIHFEGSEEIPVVLNGSVNGDTLQFSTDGFSVYAVVNDGSDEDEARATVNFYGKDTTTPLATVYVKNSDTAEELVEIVYDPGCGELDNSKKELFDGWVISTVNTTDGSGYTIETEGKTIEDIREYLESLEIIEGDIVNIYAKIVRTITVSYEGDEDNVLLGSIVLKVIGSDDPNSTDNIAEHIVSMSYTPPTSTQAFMGWNVKEGSSNILSAYYDGAEAVAPYENGTVVTLKGDVVFSVNAPYGHWLVFDENGKGATYNAPQFVKDQQNTVPPALDMVRLGYSFDGWYKLKDNVSLSNVPKDSFGNFIITNEYFDQFTFGSELNDNTTIYAKWTAVTDANYTVIVWKERMSDTYAENGGTGEGKTKNYDFAESYTFSGTVGQYAGAVSNGTSYVVDGDPGATRYYNARIQGTDAGGTSIDQTVSYLGYHCAVYDTEVEIKPEGTSVINVYYDRNTVTYTFYTYGASPSGGEWKLCTEEGNVHTGRIAVLREGGDPNNANDYTEFHGTPSPDDGRTYYYSTSGGCNGDTSVVRELHWEYIPNSGNRWNVYQESTGLYGESLNWPTDTSIWWYDDHTNTSVTGTRMTYKDAFLPLDNKMNVEYWGTQASASGTIHFWTQNLDGTTYKEEVYVNAGTANFQINDKFTGFYAVQYRTDNGSWRNVGSLDESTGIYGNPVSYRERLDIRYDRMKAAITFLDGAYFDGNGNPVDETPQAEPFHTTGEYYFGADVSSYGTNGNDYYTPPQKVGYTFGGWYADDACTIPYTFSEMPITGITVYAKWIKNQYRVFLHPNVPETDTTLYWGSDDQDMNFRVSSGEKVSTPTGTRTDYQFIGWYLDEACTQVFDSTRFVLTDTSVTTPYDKTVDLTDPMNKYGNIENGNIGYNADLTGYNGGDRFWITKKLDLYAKWRAVLTGANGIGISYDPNGGTNAPTDTTLYLDNTDTIAQGASTPPDDTQQFLYWVVQKWDDEKGKYVDLPGEEYHVYPGASFTVLKENARIVELEGSTEDDPKYSYTVQLRAEYGPKDEPTPTNITWYANGGISSVENVDRYIDPNLQINQGVDIRPADTFKRDGYTFLGWARIDSSAEDYEIGPMDLTEDDLFLKYEDGAFYAQITDGSDEWSVVTQVAADEKNPYHDLYAVWENKTYTVSVTKYVTGLEGDDEIPFTFNSEGLGDSSAFRLVGNENGADIGQGSEIIHIEHTKVFENVPYGSEIIVRELTDDNFNVNELYSITDADNSGDNVSNRDIVNGASITVKGNVQISFNNTRKTKRIRIKKTEPDKNTPLGGAVFTTMVDGTNYTFTSDDDDGYLKNETYADGDIIIPFGEYTITETNPPVGYLPLESDVVIVVNASGVSAAPYDVKDPEGNLNYYTVIIPNNPGVVLPATGGIGTVIYRIVGILIILITGVLLIIRRRNAYIL